MSDFSYPIATAIQEILLMQEEEILIPYGAEYYQKIQQEEVRRLKIICRISGMLF